MGLALLALLWPRVARAEPPCARVTALQLEADERELLTPLLCEGRRAAETQPSAAVATAIDRLVAAGGWKASLAADATRTLQQATGGFKSRAREAQAALLVHVQTQLEQCSTVGDSLEAGFERLDHNMYPSAPLGLRQFDPRDPAPGCAKLAAELEPELENFVLATYYGGVDDEVEVLVAGDNPWLAGAARYGRSGGPGLAQILVLPKGFASSLVFRQGDLDVPWVYSLSPTDSITKIPKHARELDIQLTAARAAEVMVMVDGVRFEPAELSGPLSVAEGNHTLAATVDGRYRGSKEVETLEAGSALPVPLDLHAGDTYGLTELTIDSNCAVAPPQVRKLVEQYFEQRGLQVQQLDVLAQILHSFRSHGQAMGEGQAVGAERLDYATERQIAKLAGEVTRQGAQKLLTIEVTCRRAEGEILVAGQVIDLDEFARRSESSLRGKAVSNMLEVQTAIVDEPGELREGFEQMLGVLVSAPTVEFVTRPPTRVDLYRPLRVEYRVALNDSGPDAEAQEFELGVLEVSGASTICRRARDVAQLSSFDIERLATELDELVEPNLPTDEPGLVRRRARTQLQLRSTITLDGSRPDRQIRQEIPLRDPGHYLLWLREIDGSAVTVTCFEVYTRVIALSVDAGGNLLGYVPGYGIIFNLFHTSVGVSVPLGRRRRVILGLRGEYRRTTYRADELPRPNSPLLMDLTTESWSRHGVGPVLSLGYQFPLSRCGYAFSRDQDVFARQQRRCRNVNLRRWTVTAQGSFGTNIGDFNLEDMRRDSYRRSSLEKAKRDNGHGYDIDVDLALDLRVSMRVTPLVGVYAFGRLGYLDIARSIPCNGELSEDLPVRCLGQDDRLHLGDERQQFRLTVGFGLAFYLVKTRG